MADIPRADYVDYYPHDADYIIIDIYEGGSRHKFRVALEHVRNMHARLSTASTTKPPLHEGRVLAFVAKAEPVATEFDGA